MTYQATINAQLSNGSQFVIKKIEDHQLRELEKQVDTFINTLPRYFEYPKNRFLPVDKIVEFNITYTQN